MSAVSEAIRQLRETEYYSCHEAATRLEAYFADPPAEEVERLAGIHCQHALAKDGTGTWRQDTASGIRAVLRALGEQP
jgi:hypothetical protein